MNKTFKKSLLLLFIVCLSAFPSIKVWAQDRDLTYSVSFTEQELDDLLGPIALYQDPLLAQMLPASTYPSEVADADAWLNSGGDMSSIDEQIWAESVRAITHYPGVLQMMAENMDWTANLGDAFLNQPEDVTNSIQRLRWRARALGNLVSNAEQTVIVDGDYIQIVPAQPRYIYVPQYDTSVVYVETSPFITFGYGFAIGGWLSMDFDWGRHHVIYHGWDRPGWVNHARPYVHVRNVYVDRSRPVIDPAWRHDRSHGDPAKYLASRPSGPNTDRYTRVGEVRGNTTIKPRSTGAISVHRGDTTRINSNRGQESRGIVNQQPAPVTSGIRRPAVPTPNISQRPTPPPPGVSERPTTPTPEVSQRPTPPPPGVSERPTTPTPEVRQRPATPPPGVSERPTTPTPEVRQRPATPPPAVNERPTTPTPEVRQRPATPPPVVNQRPAPVPQVSSGSNQPSPARASEQPGRSPSVTFGGYRGNSEARTQSVRGQDSRQSAPARPSAAPASRGSAPERRDTSGDRQRR